MYLSLLLVLLSFDSVSSTSTLPDRFFKSVPSCLSRTASQEYLQLTQPLPSDRLTPSCSLPLLHHDFGNTMGSPPVSVPYSPPSDCPVPWSHVVLEIRVSCRGEQYDRIAGVWLGGAEILRTSTAEPTECGIFWKVRKDVTRYSSLLARSDLALTVMLENIVNDVFTGVYHVNVSLFYYSVRVTSGVADHKLNRKLGFLKDHKTVGFINKEGKLGFVDKELGFDVNSLIIDEEPVNRVNSQQNLWNLYETPADLIIPISDDGDNGFWFRIESESDVHSKGIRIPRNTRKAVLEVYLSFHGNDEFWYSNPPNSYMRRNNLTTGRGNGAYREVFVTIDGDFVASEVPFPVIFTGGINPLFWEPVVAIGAFDLPSYDFDLTALLGSLVDGKAHSFGLGVADSIPFWLVDANLHLWLDHSSSAVQARAVVHQSPTLSVKRVSKFKLLDGSFKIVAKRKIQFEGWVVSTAGNLTTRVLQEFKFKNLIRFQSNGTYKFVTQKIKTKTQVRVESDTGNLVTRAIVNRRYPLNIITSTLPGSDKDTYLTVTNVSHALMEKASNGNFSRSVHNSQDSGGWMVVKDHSVLSGAANTNQSFSYKDEFGCYSRTVAATKGRLYKDNSTFTCASSL